MTRTYYPLLFLLIVFQLSGAPAFARNSPEINQDESVSFPSDTPADSQDEPEMITADTDEWQFYLAPLYIWFAGIKGESSIGPVAAPLDISFSDVFDNLDTAFTFHFEARKKKWGLFVDYMLMDISAQQSGLLGSTPMGAPIGVTVDTNVHNNIVEFGGSYMIRDAYPSVELLAGVRYTNLELSAVPVAKNFPVPLPSVNVEEDWWDGFGGIRFIQKLGDNSGPSGWSLIGKADVGGGGSNLTWSALAAVDWQYKTWGSVRAGYKWLGYDYQTGSGPSRFTYDVVYQGPIVGMVFNW